MPKPSEIAEWKERYSAYCDEQLIAEKHQWVENSEMHIAAVQLLHERQKAREEANHARLLAEIKRPHWSTTPAFWVSVIAMVAACIAAAPVLFPQAQFPAAIDPSAETMPFVHLPSANSQQPLPRTPTSQPLPVKSQPPK